MLAPPTLHPTGQSEPNLVVDTPGEGWEKGGEGEGRTGGKRGNQGRNKLEQRDLRVGEPRGKWEEIRGEMKKKQRETLENYSIGRCNSVRFEKSKNKEFKQKKYSFRKLLKLKFVVNKF